jgi:hypothetical protein
LPIDAFALVLMALLRTLLAPNGVATGAETVDLAKARLQIVHLAGLRRAAEGRILWLGALR